jgi:hypothetical protein
MNPCSIIRGENVSRVSFEEIAACIGLGGFTGTLGKVESENITCKSSLVSG